jgi:hypothetical protein
LFTRALADLIQRQGGSMAFKAIKKGEVICIASGVFESYHRFGPFLVEMDFDLNEFVTSVNHSKKENWEIAELMHDIPRMLLAQGILSPIACRNVHLGAFGELQIKEEKDDHI